MIALSYNKTHSTNGKDKVVARFLPEEVGDLLVKYLFIRKLGLNQDKPTVHTVGTV